MKRVISLGAGVQSSAMALMASAGVFGDVPDAAVFADTQAEPASVYEYLAYLMEPGRLAFPVYIVTNGSLLDQIGTQRPRGKWARLAIPAFAKNVNGKGGMLNRSCTQDYKIRPIRRKVRELCGLHKKRSPLWAVAEQWIGISTDEASRMRDSREPWLRNRYPLIEIGASRADCLRWIRERGLPLPSRSACVFCPFHSEAEWAGLNAKDRAVANEVDERIRNLRRGQRSGEVELYLHRSLRPLATIDFDKSNDRSLFADAECEGMCGV